MPITHAVEKIIYPECEGDVLQVRDLHLRAIRSRWWDQMAPVNPH
jgi:hypothetical protein